MADKLGQSIVAKLLELGFTEEEIQYQFTGSWDAQPERELDKAAKGNNGNNGRRG